MLVEFSPWETTDTSLRLSVPKQRKRPRGGLSSSSSVCDTDDNFAIAGSIITTKTSRSRKQRKQCPDSSRAVLAITAPYRVSVLVSQSTKGTATGAPKTEALDAAYDSLHESAKLQYTCRPGKKAGLLPGNSTGKSAKGKKAASGKPKKIPVVFDSKNDRFWGLQDGNKRLVMWDAQSEGPDSKEASSYYEMEQPVVSLHILPSGMVVGSTADLGCIYYASVDKDDNSNDIQVHYLSAPDGLLEEKAAKESNHAGTFLSFGGEAPASTATVSALVGTKRKSSEHGSPSYELYQVFVSGSSATIILHELVPSAVDPTVDHLERRKHRVADLSLSPAADREDGSSDTVVREATLIPTTIGNPETALLQYRISQQYYCCNIQLKYATLTNPPYKVDCGPQRLALVTSKILAMGTQEKIRLCDANSGIVLKEEPLPFPSSEEGENDFLLLSDPRKGCLVALFRQGEILNASTTTLQLEEDNDANASSPSSPTFRPSLAARLAASLSASQTAPKVSRKPAKRITLLVEPDLEAVKTVDMELGGAIQVMIEEEEAMMSTNSKDFKYTKGRLVKSFQRSVDCLLKSPIVLRNCATVPLFPSSSSSSLDAAKARRKGSSSKDAESDDEVMNGDRKAPSNSATPEINDAPEVTPSDTSMDGDTATKGKEGKTDTPKGRESSNGSSSDALEKFPLEFVDAVTPIVVRILRHTGSQMPINERASQMIKEDCCQVLHSLLASGNVSVRKHIGSAKEDFASLLLAMRCKQAKNKNKRSRSPVDFIQDLLRYCTDVSEALMVSMMHFMLGRASPDDISFAFLDSKALDSDHRYKALASRYLKQLGSKQSKESAKKLEHTKSKLLIAGSSAILEMILRYSRCNPALLVAALRETFSFGYETRLLSRLLADVAFPRYTRTTLSNNHEGMGSLVGSAAQWIPALFDAFGSEMRSAIAEQSDVDNLEHVHKSLTMARLQTEQLLKLEEKINESTLRISEQEDIDKEEEEKEGDGNDEQRRQRKRRRTRMEDDALPGYSVERLSL